MRSVASGVLSRFSATYELLVDLLVCLGAITLVLWAVRSRDYVLAAGFLAVAVVFSPFLLVPKIFLLMSLTCIATLLTVFATFRTPAPPLD